MTALTAADLMIRHHRRAVRFFWTWLMGATLTSLAGNIIHAVLTAPENLRWIAAVIAAVPPTVLLCAVHGIAVLAKTNASGTMYRVSVTATGALALGAFFLSFVALRDLAVIAGIGPRLAAVLPLVIDLAVAVATAALVAIGEKPPRRGRNAASTATQPAARSATANRVTIGRDRGMSALPDGASATASAPHDATDAIAQLAAKLVAAKATRQSVEKVEAILLAHQNGDPLNRIAAVLGVHHSAVKRVLDAAAPNRERYQHAAV